MPLVATVRKIGLARSVLVDELRCCRFRDRGARTARTGRRGRSCSAPTTRTRSCGGERVAARAGGNPLLLEELSASGEPTESLELALAARLRALAPESRRIARDSWRCSADRSTQADLPDAEELRHGTAPDRRRNGRVPPSAISRGRRRKPRRGRAPCGSTPALARLVIHAGEAARHHAAAGERVLAYERALEAAETADRPGELAAHLEIAASCADGADADALRLRAAALLVEVGSFAAALSCFSPCHSRRSAEYARRVLLQRARAAIGDHDLDRALVLDSRGPRVRDRERHPGGGRSRGRARDGRARDPRRRRPPKPCSLRHTGCSRSPSCRLRRRRGVRRDRARPPAARGSRLGGRYRSRPRGGARRRRNRNRVPYRRVDRRSTVPRGGGAARPSAVTHLRRRELETSGSRAGSDVSGRDRRGSRCTAAGTAARSRKPRRCAWRNSSGSGSSSPTSPPSRQSISGCTSRSRELLADLYLLSTTGHERLRQTLWVRADADLWFGRPRESLTAADELLDRFPTRGVGICPRDARMGLRRSRPRPRGAADQSADSPARGSTARAGGARAPRPRRRCRRRSTVSQAEAAWRGQHERGRLRCAWAEGEALRRPGKQTRRSSGYSEQSS